VSKRPLFTHETCPEVTVARMFRLGLVGILAPRLTAAGASELQKLIPLLASVILSDEADARRLSLCAGPKLRMDTSSLYRLCTLGGVHSPHSSFIWSSRAPSRIRFFGWLLV
jgi:hypothetical protein